MSSRIPYHLIHKSLTEGLQGADKESLSTWINSDKDSSLVTEEVTHIWDASLNAMPDVSFDFKKAENKFRSKLATEELLSVPNSAKVVSLPSRRRYFSIAASFLILFGMAAFWSVFYSNPTIHFESKSGMMALELPDNTKVWLNENASISYKKNLDKNSRDVEITGEVFFDVMRDESRPFIVSSNLLEVEVLGTSFNVNNNSVSVEEGLVQMKSVTSGKLVRLTMREKGTLDGDVIQVETLSSLNTSNWRNAGLRFMSTPLDKVVLDIENYFDVTIDISSLDEDALSSTFTSTANADISLEDMLMSLEKTLGLSAQINGADIVLSNH